MIYNQWDAPFDYRISGLFYSESILGSYVEKNFTNIFWACFSK